MKWKLAQTDDTAAFSEKLNARLHQQEIPSLNGLRAVAIVAVMAYHYGTPIAGIDAATGVMLFFVLSGFLITWLLLQERKKHGEVSLVNFYIRRSLRIFPAFGLFFITTLAILIFSGKTIAWGHALSCFFYYNNYYYSFASAKIGQFQHVWSLAVEEQFYLLWPVIFVLFSRNMVRLTYVLVWAIVIFWLYRAALCVAGIRESYLYRAFDTRADHLLVGCLLAVSLYRGFGMRLWAVLCRPIAVVAVVAFLQVSLYLHGSYRYRFIVGHSVEPLLLMALLLQAIVLGAHYLNWKPIDYIGRISYGLYLYHELGGSFGERLMAQIYPTSPVWLTAVASSAATVSIAAASFHLFEQPILRLKARLQRTTSPGFVIVGEGADRAALN